MRIRIGYEIVFSLPGPTELLLALFVRPERAGDLEQPEHLVVEPAVPVTTFLDVYSNRCARIAAPAGTLRLYYDNVCRDSGDLELWGFGMPQHAIGDLPPDVLPFLLASRYCEVDRLSDVAWGLFGQVAQGWPRVQAVCDWVHANVQFGYQFARPTKTAFETYQERTGVCRDLMHLAVTFLRAMSIPARYSTGYLGDIGVPIVPSPMDFSACLEVYLGGCWWIMDARHNVRRIGRILMAHGRDAADVAMTTSFGLHNLEKFRVWTDELK
jgi:transglutaminase-like putative cysteine protease